MLDSSEPGRLALVGMFVFATMIGAAMLAFPDWAPITAIVLPMVMGGLFLGPRALPWFVVYNLVLLTLALPKLPMLTFRGVVSIFVLFLLAFILMVVSFRRSRLGIAGTMGETMLADLSDRIQGQGVLPDDHRLAIGDEADVANQRFVEDGINALAVILGALRQSL